MIRKLPPPKLTREKKKKKKKLTEGVLETGTICNLGQSWVLRSRFLVRRGLQSPQRSLHTEHVFALAVEDHRAELEWLCAEEFCHGYRDGRRRSRLDGLRAWRGAMLMLRLCWWLPFRLPTRATLLLLLLLHLLLPLRHLHPFYVFDELGHRHAILLGFRSQLPLHGGDLLGGRHRLPGRGHKLNTRVWLCHGRYIFCCLRIEFGKKIGGVCRKSVKVFGPSRIIFYSCPYEMRTACL